MAPNPRRRPAGYRPCPMSCRIRRGTGKNPLPRYLSGPGRLRRGGEVVAAIKRSRQHRQHRPAGPRFGGPGGPAHRLVCDQASPLCGTPCRDQRRTSCSSCLTRRLKASLADQGETQGGFRVWRAQLQDALFQLRPTRCLVRLVRLSGTRGPVHLQSRPDRYHPCLQRSLAGIVRGSPPFLLLPAP